MRRFGLVLAVTTVLVLGACSTSGKVSDKVAGGSSGSGSSSTTDPHAATTAAGPTDVSRAAYSVAWSDAYADVAGDDRCLSGRLVDLLGTDQLNAAGITAAVLATEPVLDALELDDAEREQLTADVAQAVIACNVSDRLVKEWLSSDDTVDDYTAFVDCVAGPLSGELAALVVDGLAEGQPDDVFEAVGDALEVADAGCAELQVEMARRIYSEDGPPLTAEERACLLEGYQALAKEHRALTADDDEQVDDTCFGG